MTQQTTKAFTLVELIVVITILAILGTIAFISFQGYSKDARDATRASDLTNITKALELYSLNTSRYPVPTNPVDVTYSGSIVWQQGTVGESVQINLQKLNKLPLDPNYGNEYTYSVLNTGKQYQLAGVIEGDIVYNPIIPQANASNLRATVKGNYNELLAKTDLIDPNTCRVISLPSIILSDTETTTELTDALMGSGKLVFNGRDNLPDSYKSIVKENRSNKVTFRDYNTEKDTLELTNSNCIIDETNIDSIITKLSESYSGTSISNKSIYTNIEKEKVVEVVNKDILGENNGLVLTTILENGGCGSDNGGAFTNIPTNLCNVGTSTGVISNPGNFTWECNGTNGGTSTSCSATRQYTVTFNSNGGGTPSIITKKVNYNTQIGSLSTVTASGYIFNGWYDTLTPTVTFSSKLTFPNCSNHTGSAGSSMSTCISSCTNYRITEWGRDPAGSCVADPCPYTEYYWAESGFDPGTRPACHRPLEGDYLVCPYGTYWNDQVGGCITSSDAPSTWGIQLTSTGVVTGDVTVYAKWTVSN